MKKLILRTILLTGIIGCLVSCNSRKNEEVIIENKFKINIPIYMSETSSLNENAILQYQSQFRNIYVMVIEDTKDGFHNSLVENEINDQYTNDLEGFAELMFSYGGFWNVNNEDEIEVTMINGLNAKVIETTNRIEGIDIFYKAALVEGKSSYYQVIAWTSSNKESKNKDDIRKIIDSFTEL